MSDKNKKTNGDKAAYSAIVSTEIYQTGLTKREYFAGQALQGVLAGGFNVYEDAAKIALCHAEGMLNKLEE